MVVVTNLVDAPSTEIVGTNMSEWIKVHRMVHAVESLTFKLYEGEEPPKDEYEADRMFHEHEDDWNSQSELQEIADTDYPHSYTTYDEKVDGILQKEHYVSLEVE